MAQNLKIDPATGDYVVVDGRPVETDSLDTECYFRIKIEEGSFMYTPGIGSQFAAYHRRHTPEDRRGIVAMGTRSLKPLIDSGRATEIDFVGVTRDRQSEGFTVKYIQAQGEPSVFFIPVK